MGYKNYTGYLQAPNQAWCLVQNLAILCQGRLRMVTLCRSVSVGTRTQDSVSPRGTSEFLGEYLPSSLRGAPL